MRDIVAVGPQRLSTISADARKGLRRRSHSLDEHTMQKMLLTRRGRFGCNLYGDPSMPPLVLVMGLGMNSASWPEPFLTRLVRKGLYVIALDNRDSGMSMLGTEAVTKTRMFASIAKYIAGGSVQADYRLEDMAGDIELILDELGVERAHIAGISMGGMIAQVFACRAPHRTVSLTSISSATGNVLTGVGNPVAIRTALQPAPESKDRVLWRKYLRSVMSAIGTKGEVYDDAALDKIIDVEFEYEVPAQAKMRQLMAILASGDRRAQLRQLSVPTLVIHGTADPLLPFRAGKETAECIEGARFMPIEGMGHDLAAAHQLEMADSIAAHCYGTTVR
jgi:pimeloyl-ACP methyl ester carboxylesterase